MASVEWRKIPTVLYPQEVLDKAFRRASKQSTLVEDPDKYHRVRKQMARMVQAASDTIAETLLKWVDQWPSLNAQSEFDQHQPDVIVGSSRGGAVAMALRCDDTPLVLLCPAWKNWGQATRIKPGSLVFHSRLDDVIPFEDSEELVARSGLPPETVVQVGADHRLADPGSLQAMLAACVRPCD